VRSGLKLADTALPKACPHIKFALCLNIQFMETKARDR